MATHIVDSTKPWVPRKAADQLFEKLVRSAAGGERGVHIFFVLGMAGTGKTFMCRDLGVRLGSVSGFEPGQQGNLFWPGLLDMFDPSTCSNQGLELRIRQGFEGFGFKFQEYIREREIYDMRYKSGYRGASVEKQRKAIERGFANGLSELSQVGFPIIPLDTVERLDSATDPVQQEFNLQTDTASMTGWLIYQIRELQNGAIIFFGRKTRYFHDTIRQAINDLKEKGKNIELEEILLEALEPEDMRGFYAHRLNIFPEMAHFLNSEIHAALEEKTGRNPLALDMVLQTLSEAPDPRKTLADLKLTDLEPGILQQRLLEAYRNVLSSPLRKAVLHYLAVARNGLHDDLLRALEPGNAEALVAELKTMERLPFVKARKIHYYDPVNREYASRKTYFLHDEMYLLYDRQIKDEPTLIGQIVEDSRRLADYYDQQISSARKVDLSRMKGERPTPVMNDLVVESLVYRLRADPNQGYLWFLFQEDKAIRGNISIGLDMRLRDSMGQFINTAIEGSKEPGYSLASPVDEENIKRKAADLLERFHLDSILLWVKRLSARGDNRTAIAVSRKYLDEVSNKYRNTQEYLVSLAELRLWYGQALMYNANHPQAVDQYLQVLALLNPGRSLENLFKQIENHSLDPFLTWRICLVIGRTLNNLGYLCWRNMGQYRMAIQYFQEALPIFRIPESFKLEGLEEEIANTTDNMARVYSHLGRHRKAAVMARKALEDRENLGLTYRQALSENSLAIILGNSGQFDQALVDVDNAMMEFRGAEAGRGVGLASITLAMLLRKRAEDWRETKQPISTAIRDTEMAEVSLREAAVIFADDVTEPIHLVDVYNELGCCMRTRYLLQREHLAGNNPGYLSTIYTQGEASFQRSIEEARRHEFWVEMLDSLQDLSVLYLRAGMLGKAEKTLAEVREYIVNKSPDYMIRKGAGLIEIQKDKCIDAFYKLLGQVELEEGAIAFGKAGAGNLNGNLPIDSKVYLEICRHYVFAMVYFTHYSDEAYSMERTFDRMNKRFQKCDVELKKEITEKFIPSLVEEYKLPKEPIAELMADVFGYFP